MYNQTNVIFNGNSITKIDQAATMAVQYTVANKWNGNSQGKQRQEKVQVLKTERVTCLEKSFGGQLAPPN